METYTELSEVYDYLLKDVDYDSWYSFLRTLMLKYVKNPSHILELGCGTGKFGAKFSRDNYLIYGMDKSLEMLMVAKMRAFKYFRIFCGDMTNFYLSKNFDFIFTVNDTMNYLTNNSEITNTLRSIRKVMHKNSIFMFDITTEYNIIKNFDGKVTRFNVKGMEVEWSNKYDSDNGFIYSTINFYKKDGSFSTERHVQRIYSIAEIEGFLKRENYKLIDIFGDYSFSSITADTIMINFVTRKG